MYMKKSLFCLCLVLFAACQGNKPAAPAVPSADSSQVVTPAAEPDTTTYGTALDQGMSVFIMRTEAGDTIEALREDWVGDSAISGRVFGAPQEGDRFAATFQPGSDPETPVVKVAINLTDVEAVTGREYAVSNGKLILRGDTVDLIDLTPTALKAKSRRDGKLYDLKK